MGLKSVRWEGRDVCPSKVVCVGRNYVEHIAELKNEVPESMVVFFKPNSAISDTLTSGCSEERHYEAEICLLVNDGRFAAVGVGIDLTKRGLQSRLKEKGLPWERSKAFDGAAVFGDFVSLPQPIPELTVELRLNGSVVQRGSTGQMIYPPATIMEELKTFTTLQDGDIVMTGTPKGVGKIESGVVFSGRILEGDRELVAKTWTAD